MRFLALILVLVLPCAALGQNALVAGLIEDSLSGSDRAVKVTGFNGALSSRATMEELTISDSLGVWLRLEEAVLDWNRAALLRGRLDIDELSAARIHIERLPSSDSAAPSPQASGFRIPELPVSVDIKKFAISDLQLGPGVLGEDIAVTVAARASLDGGAAQLQFDANRTDGTSGRAQIDLNFDPTTETLSAFLDVSEPENGLIVRALNLPGSPSLQLTIDGTGQLDAYAADVTLQTDGDKRLSGKVTLEGQDDDTRLFTADIGGDIRPLLATDTRAFFGSRTEVIAEGQTLVSGGVQLSNLQLTTEQAQLAGRANINAAGEPTLVALNGALRGNEDILLPGTDISVNGADLVLNFDAAQSDDWSVSATVQGLDTNGVSVEEARIKGDGSYLPDESLPFSGLIKANLAGLIFSDPAMTQAVGPNAQIQTNVSANQDGQVLLSNLIASTTTAQLSGDAVITPKDGRVLFEIETTIDAPDLKPFSLIAAPLKSGELSAKLSAEAAFPTGTLSMQLAGQSRDLDIGNAQAFPLINPETSLELDIIRDLTGTQVKTLTLNNQEIRLSAKGMLSETTGSFEFDAELEDANRIAANLSGPISVSGQFQDPYASRRVDVKLDSALGVIAELSGTLAETENAVRLTAQIADLRKFVPELPGPANLAVTASDIYDTQLIKAEIDTDFGLVAIANGPLGSPNGVLDFNARLSNIGQFAPNLSGGMQLNGQLTSIQDNPRINARIETDSGARANVSGPITSGALAADGTLPLDLAAPFIGNRALTGLAGFDLSIVPSQQLAGITGTISAQGSRFTDPDVGLTIAPLNTTVRLDNGRATVTATGSLNGGTVSANGTLGLRAPFLTDMRLRLQQVNYRYLDVLSTQLYSDLSLQGPAQQRLSLSGTIQLGKLEIRVPDTGLGGAETIPDITHLGLPARARQTLSNAGLPRQSNDARSTGPDIPLDITISALDPIFVRGRGLDAEFGGGLRITGRVSNPTPVGQFELRRGRLNLLGQRLNLTEGTITAAGQLVPSLRIVAESQSDDVLARIILSGPADAPSLEFSSVPDLPEDEILARLLFGRSASNLSPFQVARLISSLAQLAGKGGPGILDNTRQQLGFDDLDFRTDETTGEAELAIGEYLTDNVYTEVELGAGGNTQINLNLDVTDSTTVRGSVGADGNTSLGIFWEKDY